MRHVVKTLLAAALSHLNTPPPTPPEMESPRGEPMWEKNRVYTVNGRSRNGAKMHDK